MSDIYRIATKEDFDFLWDRNIRENPDEPMWPVWRERFRQRIESGTAVTFCVAPEGEPVGECTLELNTGKPEVLCNGTDTAYLSALRIRQEYEGQGHISKLVRMAEEHARKLGFSRVTIGVEEGELRNRAIYDHWGYVNLIMTEEDDGTQVLYYAKEL